MTTPAARQHPHDNGDPGEHRQAPARAAHPHPLETEEGDTIVTHPPAPRHLDNQDHVVPMSAHAFRRPPTHPEAEPPPSPLGSVLTVDQAADRMNMSVRYVRRLVADRRIAFHRIGRSIRLTTADVDAHIRAGRVEPLTTSDVWRDLRSVI